MKVTIHFNNGEVKEFRYAGTAISRDGCLIIEDDSEGSYNPKMISIPLTSIKYWESKR